MNNLHTGLHRDMEQPFQFSTHECRQLEWFHKGSTELSLDKSDASPVESSYLLFKSSVRTLDLVSRVSVRKCKVIKVHGVPTTRLPHFRSRVDTLTQY